MIDVEELFLKFMRESSDDYCVKCAYYTPEKCPFGAWGVNEHGDVESNNDLYASAACLDGLLKNYMKESKNANRNT